MDIRWSVLDLEGNRLVIRIGLNILYHLLHVFIIPRIDMLDVIDVHSLVVVQIVFD